MDTLSDGENHDNIQAFEQTKKTSDRKVLPTDFRRNTVGGSKLDRLQKLKESKGEKPSHIQQLQDIVNDFNKNRSPTQYEKIQEKIKNNPLFKSKVERDDFVQKIGARCGIMMND